MAKLRGIKCPTCGAAMDAAPDRAILQHVTAGTKRAAIVEALIERYPLYLSKTDLVRIVWEGKEAPDGFRQAMSKARDLLSEHGWTIDVIGSRGTRSTTRYKLRKADHKPPNYVVRYRDAPGKDATPEVKRRITNLLKRGFDVPPSREEEFNTYRSAHYKLSEIREIMKLE